MGGSSAPGSCQECGKLQFCAGIYHRTYCGTIFSLNLVYHTIDTDISFPLILRDIFLLFQLIQETVVVLRLFLITLRIFGKIGLQFPKSLLQRIYAVPNHLQYILRCQFLNHCSDLFVCFFDSFDIFCSNLHPVIREDADRPLVLQCFIQ